MAFSVLTFVAVLFLCLAGRASIELSLFGVEHAHTETRTYKQKRDDMIKVRLNTPKSVLQKFNIYVAAADIRATQLETCRNATAWKKITTTKEVER